jgi:hypothetical protein
MVNLGMPPLPPNTPFFLPFNYLEYVKDYNPNVHVRVFKVASRANSEIDDAKVVHLFIFTLENIVCNWCNNYMGDYPNCIFVKL